MLVHFHERGRFYERTSEKDAMLRCKFDQKKKVPPVRRHLVEKRYWLEVFPERSVYLIGYFNPNRGLCGVALGIGYLQPDFV